LVLLVVAGLVSTAVAGRLLEQAGLLTCDCASHCWCKQPGYNLFRWVVPKGWHNPAGPLVESEPESSQVDDLARLADTLRAAQSSQGQPAT
jgi:hypothetical protein